jgi:hypothetical protein
MPNALDDYAMALATPSRNRPIQAYAESRERGLSLGPLCLRFLLVGNHGSRDFWPFQAQKLGVFF